MRFLFALFLLATPGFAATHYVCAATGSPCNASDSNNGTTKTTAWLHAPGMPSCSGSCASYTPAAGDSIIFRGGDTWHFGNSSAAPYVGAGGWNWTWGGSGGGGPIYIGVDVTWYSGGSFTRPILTEDNSLTPHPGVVNDTVSSCTYQVSGGNQEINIGGTYVTFDNFEFTGFCWNSNTFGNNIMLKLTGSASPNHFIVENCYAHGWTHTSGGQAQSGTWLESYNQEPGLTMQYNIVDGADSDPATLNYQAGDLYIMAYNVIRYNQGQNSTSGCYRIHDNLFEHMDNVADGSGAHSDVLQCYGETSQGAGDPNLWYNNLFRYIPDSGSALSDITWHFPPAGQTDYEFNNVYHDIADGSNYIDINQGGGPGGGNVAIFNDTAVLGTSGCIVCNGANIGTVTSTNNHWVASPATQASVFTSGTGLTETAATYMTPATAATQGYTSANDYSPTSSSNSTVTASGTNKTSFCNGLADSTAKTACLAGTSNGCTYNSTAHTISCPDLSSTARPSSGAWNSGAYQFGGSTAPTVTTTLATNITTTSAYSGGTVTSNGGASVTSEGVCYGTSPNPTVTCTSDGTSTPFTSSITGETPATTIYYQAFAVNSVGTSYGGEGYYFQTLTTSPGGTSHFGSGKVF